jgi:hypothetical protein
MFDQAHKILAAYGPQATLMTTKGLGHRRILSDPSVIETAVRFVTEAEPQAARHRA